MALAEYQRKRDFRRTPEPAGSTSSGKKAPAAATLSFVVQKHAATRLHYDFRLELNGVLLSWAIPKGPSLDPGEKRLAVHVEDHPIEYGGFEGVIPKGQYGGGTVLLWDRGTWTPEGPDVDEAYRKGSLKFRLDGAKLHGNWALVRMGGKAAPKRPGDHENWLLIKERDAEAMPGSDAALVDDNPLSVASGRTMEAIAADRDRVWDSSTGEVAGDPAPAASRKPAANAEWVRRKGVRERAMPDWVAPQLATLAEAPPDGDEWLHEIKYDGYRMIAQIDGGTIRLLTRNRLDWTAKFPALARDLAALPVESAVIDGEVVVLTADGVTSFAALQDHLSRGDNSGMLYFAFDLLYRDGHDLTGATLTDRKSALAALLSTEGQSTVRYSDHQRGHGPAFFRQACGYEVEGIISKRADRPYRAGRSTDWLKIKCHKSDEFIIVGFTDPAGQRYGFGALQLGYYDPHRELRYAGRCGTGFSDAVLAELHANLAALERREPTVSLPKGVSRKGVHWVEPRLVAEVRYANWTLDDILRHASFQGLREDKSAAEIVYDLKGGTARPVEGAEAASPLSDPPPFEGEGVRNSGDKRKSRTATAQDARTSPRTPSAPPPQAGEGRVGASRERKPASAAAAAPGPSISAPARDGSITFEGVRLTNPDRILYPDQRITKLDLARYYAAIGAWAFPELRDRPLSLVRCPEGVGKECFYQKHLSSGVPDALGRVALKDKSGSETFLFIKDVAGLISVVQMGVLEIHPWGSTVAKVETPDRITFDFDPDVGLPWGRVTDAAIEMREALLGIGLQSFAKTTGGKGLHVVVPVAPKLGWDAIKEFAKWVAERFVTAYPDRFTSNMAKRARSGRIFIDYLRNGRGATAIGAYSPRARDGAPVATPLFWDEVENGVTPDRFTVATVPDRLAKLKSDPWAAMRDLRQSLGAKIRREIGI